MAEDLIVGATRPESVVFNPRGGLLICAPDGQIPGPKIMVVEFLEDTDTFGGVAILSASANIKDFAPSAEIHEVLALADAPDGLDLLPDDTKSLAALYHLEPMLDARADIFEGWLEWRIAHE